MHPRSPTAKIGGRGSIFTISGIGSEVSCSSSSVVNGHFVSTQQNRSQSGLQFNMVSYEKDLPVRRRRRCRRLKTREVIGKLGVYIV